MTSWGKNKLIPIFNTDIGDPATATNVEKAAAIGWKLIIKSHCWYLGWFGGTKIEIPDKS